MKTLFVSSLLVFTLSNAVFAQDSIGALSEEDLTPFCENEMIWQPFGVAASQCMTAAKTCADINAGKALNAIEATEALYACVFKSLEIDIDVGSMFGHDQS